MPLLQNSGQPYFPDPNSPNRYQCGNEQYCHPLNFGDIIRSQFYQTPCGANLIDDPTFSDITVGPELVTNGDFATNANGWTAGGLALPNDGWSWSAGSVVHAAAPSNSVALIQSGLGLVAGTLYRVSIDVTRTDGWINVVLGDGVDEVSTDPILESGTFSFNLLYVDASDDMIQIQPTFNFSGSIDNVSVKALTFASWDANGGWVLQDGVACHVEGETGTLEETVADYITPNQYYQIEVTSSGVIQGSFDIFIANVNVGTVSVNQTKKFYGTPTLTGVISFVPTSDFIGCISSPDLRLLKNSHEIDLIASDDGSRYDVSPYLAYYNEFVTLELPIDNLELPYGCYYLEAFDACQINGDELVTDGDFADGGYTAWTRNNGSYQYAIAAGELEFIFEPLMGSNLINNGDFSTGDFTGWTAGAGWAVVGNAAVHTPGSTNTLSQTVNISVPATPPDVLQFWIQLVMSAWTAGTITVTLADKTSVTYGMNDTITFPLVPTVGGAVSFTITPSSTFDGTIDDIALHEATQIWSAFPIIRNSVNADFVDGNYDIGFEITSISTGAGIGLAMGIEGMTQSLNYESTVATHTDSVTGYVPGGQRAYLQARFRLGNNYYPGRVAVTAISAVRVEPFEATYTSECLNYQESHLKSVMVAAYCDQNAFGFEFENTGFMLVQRVVSRSLNPVWPKEKQIQRSGTGNARVVYAAIEKYWQFTTDFASETFHDAFAVQIDCDHLMIGPTEDNGVEYIAQPEDYQPAWQADGSYSLAPITVTLRVADNGQVFNRHR